MDISIETRDKIIRAMAIKALCGDTAAAKIVLEEYHTQHGSGEENPLLLSLYRLEMEAREKESKSVI